MKITILGSNSAIPAHGRMPTAQVIETDHHSILMDCGEGTQMQLSAFKVKRSRIDIVCISHLHGDHVFGLAGFLSSLNHFKHSRPMLLIGPEGLDHLVDTQLSLTGNPLHFDITYKILPESFSGIVFEDAHLKIKAFPILHRIPTFGYLFETMTVRRKIDMESVERYKVPLTALESIAKGADYQDGSRIISNNDLTFDPPPPKRYAFVSDTDFYPGIKTHIQDVDVLYHESTFLDIHKEKARETKHTTASEAGEIARICNVGRLVLGHYSSRYSDLEPLLRQAQLVFEHVSLAKEGRTIEI